MLDPISETRLTLVHPELSHRIHELDSLLTIDNIYIHVIQGLRTYTQQDTLYAQGRTTTGRIVTDAQGGYSAHNFGYAVDLDPFKDNVPDWDATDPAWQEMLSTALKCGLAEGGVMERVSR
jgi:peptidoglycan L-alanyl-D-glutamate endopeptidase CwlK